MTNEKWPSKKTLWKGFGCASVVLLLFFGAVWLINAVWHAREAARVSTCKGYMAQLQLALISYHDTYGSFPPAYTMNEHGERMHSWRVLILVYVGYENSGDEYNFEQPWNSPDNLKFANKYRHVFQCPSRPDDNDSQTTDYVLVTGDKTAFPGLKTTRIEDFKDGLEDTVLLVEIANSGIHWMEPRDMEFDKMSFQVNDPSRPSISSPHPSGPAVVFGDSIRAYRLADSLNPKVVKAMMTINGGEGAIDKESLRQRPKD